MKASIFFKHFVELFGFHAYWLRDDIGSLQSSELLLISNRKHYDKGENNYHHFFYSVPLQIQFLLDYYYKQLSHFLPLSITNFSVNLFKLLVTCYVVYVKNNIFNQSVKSSKKLHRVQATGEIDWFCFRALLGRRVG